MRDFHQPGQFIRRNHGDFLPAPAAHDHHLVIAGHAIEYGGQALAKIA
jgi:hypothetical protein